MKKKNIKKAFTLIEMLVVVIIIGLLIGIMGGKYQSFLQSGRDVNRQGGLKQMATQLEKYRMDYEYFPSYSGCVENSSSNTLYKNLVLSGKYMDKLPVDPNSKRPLYVYTGNNATNAKKSCIGKYYYTSLKASATDDYAYIVVANAETPKGMNIVTGDTNGLKITQYNTDDEGLSKWENVKCNTVIFSGSNNTCDSENGKNKGGIKKGDENKNGWFSVMGGG